MNMARHLALENLIELNRGLINQFGDGPAGVKDEGALNFIIDKAYMPKTYIRKHLFS
jgi:hypothetical protein